MGGDIEEEGDKKEEKDNLKIKNKKKERWRFEGKLGKYEKGKIKRGIKVYKEVW